MLARMAAEMEQAEVLADAAMSGGGPAPRLMGLVQERPGAEYPDGGDHVLPETATEGKTPVDEGMRPRCCVTPLWASRVILSLEATSVW